jgi:hypothetical protein
MTRSPLNGLSVPTQSSSIQCRTKEPGSAFALPPSIVSVITCRGYVADVFWRLQGHAFLPSPQRFHCQTLLQAFDPVFP